MEEITKYAREVQAELDTDIYVYFGPIRRSLEVRLTQHVRGLKVKRPNALLILATLGGSPDSAFRISRCLQAQYKDGTFRLYVDSICKSAGTMVALGANELIMSDGAELGPLDIQLSKPDELDERMSGLTPTQSLATLRTEVFNSFEDFFLNLRFRSGLQITTRTAAEVATKLAVGLFEPIYGQIDPISLGENQRAMLIAENYGSRLTEHGGNVLAGGVDRLIADYPSHEFVIERSEARECFKAVRGPTVAEKNLAGVLATLSENAIVHESDPIVALLDFEESSDEDVENNEEPDSSSDSGEDDQLLPTKTTEHGGTAEDETKEKPSDSEAAGADIASDTTE